MKRGREWSDAQIENYLLGVRYSDYPRLFWEKMQPDLAGCQTFIDAGSGPGAFALKALEAGFYVQAVDLSAKSLAYLRRQADPAKAGRLKTICGDWLQVRVEKSDISVCAYSCGGSIGTAAGLARVFELTRAAAYFIAPCRREQTDFLSRELYKQAGLEPPAFSGTYRDLLQIFKGLQKEVSYEIISYDFGMPLQGADQLDRCAAYLSDKLGLPSREAVKKHLQEIIVTRNGMLWVPNPRESAFITWRRESGS